MEPLVLSALLVLPNPTITQSPLPVPPTAVVQAQVKTKNQQLQEAKSKYRVNVFGEVNSTFNRNQSPLKGNYQSKFGLELESGTPLRFQAGYFRDGNFKEGGHSDGAFVGVTLKECLVGCN